MKWRVQGKTKRKDESKSKCSVGECVITVILLKGVVKTFLL